MTKKAKTRTAADRRRMVTKVLNELTLRSLRRLDAIESHAKALESQVSALTDAISARLAALEAQQREQVGRTIIVKPFTTSRTQPLTKFTDPRKKGRP